MRRLILAGAALGILGLTARPIQAFAAEARPWLCRDKPVFSADKPMVYELTGHGPWRLFLMQYQEGAAHDGFDIISTRDAAGSTSAHLAAGRYFAVALHRGASGHWVCPGRAERRDTHAAGVVADICFGQEEGSSCAVTLTVRQVDSAPPDAGGVTH